MRNSVKFWLYLALMIGAMTSWAQETSTESGEEFRRFEVRTAPLAFLARWYTLELSYRPSDHWAFGPSVVIYDSDPIGSMFWLSWRGQSYGLQANYYLHGTQVTTWYGGFRLYYDSYRDYPHPSGIYYDHKDLKGERAILLFGRQIKWNRVNILMGLGPTLSHYKIITKGRLDSGGQRAPLPDEDKKGWYVSAYMEFKVGIEF